MCCFSSSESRRLWELGEGKKKKQPKNQNSQWAGLLRKRTLFEFHKGFENRGGGALLFVLWAFIVPTLVSCRRKGLWGGNRVASGFCLTSPVPLARLNQYASSSDRRKHLCV